LTRPLLTTFAGSEGKERKEGPGLPAEEEEEEKQAGTNTKTKGKRNRNRERNMNKCVEEDLFDPQGLWRK
jgi:hypothetical protein